MKYLFAFFLSFSLFSVNAQDKNFAAEKIIRQNAEAFSKALVNGNWEAIVDTYTDDAKIFPSGMDIQRGEELIRKYWTPAADKKSKVIYHRLIPEEIKILGDEAYDYGYYEGRTLREDGTEVSWRGKYVVIWKEVEPGVWKMYLDIWNRVNE